MQKKEKIREKAAVFSKVTFSNVFQPEKETRTQLTKTKMDLNTEKNGVFHLLTLPIKAGFLSSICLCIYL